jgi:RNA polymerase sigma-70 factor (ECF subfamily)
LRDQNKIRRFEQSFLPHLDVAYNLARWLTRNEQDAEDVVQEAYLRAFKFFDSFHSTDGRAWLLAIVRNTYYTWRQQKQAHEVMTPFDEEIHSTGQEATNPEEVLLHIIDSQLLREALEDLPVEFREVIVLRELEGLSYKEIADIAAIPLGTVMSRLARARKRLQHYLTRYMSKES